MRFAPVLVLLGIIAAPPATRDQIEGTWRGESICAPNRSACVDEKVVYYVSAIAGKSGVVSIRADKIVNGQAETMGTGEWKHDAEHHVLTWESPRQTWLLNIDGDTIEGTLTLADTTVVRRMTLKKDL